MKKSKIFAALALSACMALGATGLIACSPNNGGTNGNGDSGYTQETDDPIMKVYKAYVTSAQANGEEPMSYEEWYADLLANAKGDKGDKGEKGEKGDKGDTGVGIKTIEIKDGKYVITFTDGETIELDIPSENHTHNWEQSKEVQATCTSLGYILYTCDVDGCSDKKYEFSDALGHSYNQAPVLSIPATCTQEGIEIRACDNCGDNKVIVTEKLPHVYEGEICKNCGHEKGVIKNFGTFELTAGATQDISFEGIENGTYWLYAELESGEAVLGGLSTSTPQRNATTGQPVGNPYAYDMFNHVQKIYKSIQIIDSVKFPATVLTNNTESTMKIKVTLREFEAPEIKDGEEIDVPAINTNMGYVPIPIDPSLVGINVKITISNWAESGYPAIYNGEDHSSVYTFKAADKVQDQTGVYSVTMTIPEGVTSLCFKCPTSKKNCNTTVKIELVTE